jgi:hypothetical protein
MPTAWHVSDSRPQGRESELCIGTQFSNGQRCNHCTIVHPRRGSTSLSVGILRWGSASLSVSRSQEKGEEEVTRDCGGGCVSLRVSTCASLRVSTGILRVALSREMAAAVPDSLGLQLCWMLNPAHLMAVDSAGGHKWRTRACALGSCCPMLM